MLRPVNNHRVSVDAYTEPARSMTAEYSAKLHNTTLKKPIQNLTDLFELSTFNHLQLIVPPHNPWNVLSILLPELTAIPAIQIFNPFLTNSIMECLAANTNSYPQQ